MGVLDGYRGHARTGLPCAAQHLALALRVAAAFVDDGQVSIRPARRRSGDRAFPRVFGARDFLMRSVLLVSVSLAGWASRTFGPQPALFMCAALVIGTGAVALAAARRPGR